MEKKNKKDIILFCDERERIILKGAKSIFRKYGYGVILDPLKEKR